MAININNLNQNPAVKQQADQAQVKQQVQKAGAELSQAKQVTKDSVSLTPQAKQLNDLQKKSADPEINQKKVQQLKAAISSGEYKIDAEKLAKNIAGFEFDLDA